MITYISEKCPSDPVSCLFECLFSEFVYACLLSFDVIMMSNKLCPLMFSHHCFRSLRRLLSLISPSGPLQDLQKVQYMISYLCHPSYFQTLKTMQKLCISWSKIAKMSQVKWQGQKWVHLRKEELPSGWTTGAKIWVAGVSRGDFLARKSILPNS